MSALVATVLDASELGWGEDMMVKELEVEWVATIGLGLRGDPTSSAGDAAEDVAKKGE